MRNEALIEVCEKLAKEANKAAEENDFLRAKVYSGLALEFASGYGGRG